MLRLLAVLDGTMPGRIFTDNLFAPQWVIVLEKVYGTLYPAANVPPPTLLTLIEQLRTEQEETLLGFWPDHAPESSAYPPPEYDGQVIDFLDWVQPPAWETFFAVPADTTLIQAHPAMRETLPDPEFSARNADVPAHIFERGLGFVLMHGDLSVAEAFAGTEAEMEADNVIEVGVGTHPDYRTRGYATCVCAHLIRACHQQGYARTYWNTNAANTASIALARKLGYTDERPYRLLAW